MKLYSRMYVRGVPDHKVIKTMRRMKKGKNVKDLYCITLPVFADGVLEIYEYEELNQEFYEQLATPVVVIGIAGSMEEAKELTTLIVDEVYQNTGDFQIWEYLRCKKDNSGEEKEK